MGTKSISALIPSPMPLAGLRSNELALSDFPRRASAGTAWAVGHTIGGDKLDTDTPNPAPDSPMNSQKGHTHSGGIDGRALYRSVATITFDHGEVRSSNLSPNPVIGRVFFNCRPTGSPPTAPQYDAGSSQTAKLGPEFSIWVPGCDLSIGAYRDMGISVTYNVAISTNVDAGDVMTIAVRNTSTGSSSTLSASTPSSTGVDRSFSSTKIQDTLHCQPGQLNILQLEASYSASSTLGPWNVANASGGRAVTIQILDVEIGVWST